MSRDEDDLLSFICTFIILVLSNTVFAVINLIYEYRSLKPEHFLDSLKLLHGFSWHYSSEKDDWGATEGNHVCIKSEARNEWMCCSWPCWAPLTVNMTNVYPYLEAVNLFWKHFTSIL